MFSLGFFGINFMKLIYFHSFLMIVSELTQSVENNFLFHFHVISKTHIIPIEYLEFAIRLLWTKDFEKIICSPWPFELRNPQLKLRLVLYLLDKFEEDL